MGSAAKRKKSSKPATAAFIANPQGHISVQLSTQDVRKCRGALHIIFYCHFSPSKWWCFCWYWQVCDSVAFLNEPCSFLDSPIHVHYPGPLLLGFKNPVE